MAPCRNCGKEPTAQGGRVKVWRDCIPCHGTGKGQGRCGSCTWHGSIRLKCCGHCADGVPYCGICKGDRGKEYTEICNWQHKK